jgi:hypothetical protein
MYILEDLWNGNITPSERVIRTGSQYAQLQKQLVAAEEDFRKELSPEGKAAYDTFCRKQAELSEISECDCFIRGVRIGARLLLDIVADYPSQTPTRMEQ